MRIESKKHREGTLELVERMRAALKHSRMSMSPTSFEQVRHQLETKIAHMLKRVAEYDLDGRGIEWGTIVIQASAASPSESLPQIASSGHLRLENAMTALTKEPAKTAGSFVWCTRRTTKKTRRGRLSGLARAKASLYLRAETTAR